ncbi:MAG: hypothetical protein D6706_12710 [Chloroflexi bacterium]|nr:MAG: hypothetical protein D6706_12710 [Chloroflexota bacterium]
MTTLDEKSIVERQRLAWAFLLGSFAICILISIAIPFGVNAALENAKEPLQVVIQANQGTVGVDDETGLRRAVLAGEQPQSVMPGSSILTDATATALMSFFPPSRETAQLLVRMRIYSNTLVRLEEADAPRFDMSESPYILRLNLENGRLLLNLPTRRERPFIIIVATPQGHITIQEPGQYSLEVNNDAAQIAVREGRALINTTNQSLPLLSDQRAVLPLNGELIGPLDTERDFIRNGDFAIGLADWSLFAWRVELPDQPEGNVTVRDRAGEPVLHIIRDGLGHADVRVRQIINQDVTDYESLRIQTTFRIVGQTLGVCGIQGSECPLFVRVDYVDDTGVLRSWQQGFYAVGEIGPETPDACISCALAQQAHLRVPLAQDYFFELNLLDELARQGLLPPRFINSVSLIASGHSFEVEVVDVALLAEE